MLKPKVGAVSLLLMRGDSPLTRGGAGGHMSDAQWVGPGHC